MKDCECKPVGGLSEHARDVLMANMLKGTLWLALLNEFKEDGMEPQDEAYRRMIIWPGDWKQVGPGEYVLDKCIQFPKSTENWGWIRGMGLMEQATGGQCVMAAPLNAWIGKGDIVRVYTGDFSVVIDGMGFVPYKPYKPSLWTRIKRWWNCL